jgi:hypothetical protein
MPPKARATNAPPTPHVVQRFDTVDAAADALDALLANFGARAKVADVVAKAGGMAEVPLDAAALRGDTRRDNHVVVAADLDDSLVLASSGEPIAPMIRLLQAVHARGGEVHVVTARLDDAEARAETLEQMEELGIGFAHLTLTPAAHRKDLAKVSQYKAAVRVRIARARGVPVALMVGDMSSDLYKLAKEEHLDHIDDAIGGSDKIVLVRLGGEGSATLWGLKLQEQRREDED